MLCVSTDILNVLEGDLGLSAPIIAPQNIQSKPSPHGSTEDDTTISSASTPPTSLLHTAESWSQPSQLTSLGGFGSFMPSFSATAEDFASFGHSRQGDPTTSRASTTIGGTVDSDSESSTPTTSRKTLPKAATEKKVMHNAIERRYRNSINDRITELGDIVPNNDDRGKPNKSSILGRAIDYITFLKKRNKFLEEENKKLREKLQLPVESTMTDEESERAHIPIKRKSDASAVLGVIMLCGIVFGGSYIPEYTMG